jgi:hypothetical protein
VTEGTTEKIAIDRPEYHSALALGLMIGRYRIISVLGEGGFGITYFCHDTQLHRDVAIKEYLPSGLAIRQGDTEVLPRSTEAAKDFVWGRSRFLDEARTMAKLSHVPAVVRVHDFLEAHGTAYVVMQLLPGETLALKLESVTRLPQAAIDRILPPLLDGLEQIHTVGFLHRDIKPANIMLAPDGLPTLIDFGASRAAVAGRSQAMTAIFTPGFAAPEQSSAGKQGPWTDIYGLAATLYACVAGKPPPSAIERLLDSDAAFAMETGGGDYSPNLLAAIEAGMMLQANARPQTIAAWRQVLATGVWNVPVSAARSASQQAGETRMMPRPPVAEPQPQAEARPAATPVAQKLRPGKPMMLTAAAVLALVLAGGAGYALFSSRSSDTAAVAPPVTTQAQTPPASVAAAAVAPAARRARTGDEASRREAAAQRQAEEQRLADEAAAAQRAQLATAMAKAAEEEAKVSAEPGEAELKLSNRDRQKLQVALNSLGFDVGGIDGTFGPRSRQTIAAWQTKNGDVSTGFFTALQKAALLSEAGTAVARWEDAQRRAYAEEQRRLRELQQAPPPPPPPRRTWKWPWE